MQFAKRVGQNVWGNRAPRKLQSEGYWKQPFKWNEEARITKKRKRVFSASMADVFEDRPELVAPRQRLFDLIEQTEWLDWQLLTKRPVNIAAMVPWVTDWPKNVWIGTTVENQEYAELRLPLLLKIPAAVRFLSCEPLLGPVDLRPWFKRKGLHPINWVIIGGESGGGSRPMHPNWPKHLLHQCQEFKVPLHFKQWGNWIPTELSASKAKPQLVEIPGERPVSMVRVAKMLAGRTLDGSTWDGFPDISPE